MEQFAHFDGSKWLLSLHNCDSYWYFKHVCSYYLCHKTSINIHARQFKNHQNLACIWVFDQTLFDGWYAPNRTFLYSRWISKLYRNVSLYPAMLHMATGFDNRLYLYWLCGHHFLPTLNVCRYFCGNTFTQPFTVHLSISVAMLAVCICKYMFVNRAPQRHRSQILPFFWREYQILPIFWGRCPNFDKYQLSKNLI